MSADGSTGPPERFEIPLAPFAQQPDTTHKSPLGDRQNLLLVRRAPGDVLRVAFDRDHLVFAPGEMFTFRLQPHALGVPAETSLRASVQLLASGGSEELWREQFDFRVREDGGADPVGPVDVLLPAKEGVYEVVISVSQRRFPEAIGAIVRSKQLQQRKIQLVVLGARPAVSEAGEWREVDLMELTSREWWERWTLLPQLKKLPGMEQVPLGLGQSPLGSTALQQISHAGQQLTQLAGRGWYAAPIPIARIGQPHLLELEYPNDLRQTLGISIMDPNAAGQLTPLGLDSGIDVPDRPKPADTKLEKHRLLFWPRTKTPWLLLTNRRDDHPGRVRADPRVGGPRASPSGVVGGGESR